MKSVDMPSLIRRSDVCCRDVLCAVLGLREIETSIYWFVLGKEAQVPEISRAVKRDRTSVQRSVSVLISCGLLTRKRLPVSRGRKYAYTSIPVPELKVRLNDELDGYYGVMQEQIRKIRSPSEKEK
ncbi:Sugar-specific transcriptional regulator TrmB [uncultured archaeon]|nr:Sugar-specific transcriptional regulator TrmB [uncultured archaeon]